ncbi:MAG: hypothetical protein A2X48_12995 [Lentisphaerae bacterium GWF2_49_21]|nr:MAG: hypothetical protein A2X48_12995 [Lentisphaerae bacterium GWF2_49_21]
MQLNPDTIYYNADIITLDAELPQAQAVAVADGKIMAVGDDHEIKALATSQTRMRNLAGKTLLPGFNDAHIHVLLSGIRHLLSVDCSGPGIADVLEALRQRCQQTPKGEWVRGILFDDEKIVEKRMLTRKELDSVSTNHPIFISHRGFHSHICNSPALAKVGFSKNVAPPTGGKFDFDANGELNGVIHETAVEPIRAILPEPDEKQRLQATQEICRKLNSAGITSVQDGRTTAADLATYQQAEEQGILSLRVAAMMHYNTFENLKSVGIKAGFGNRMIRIMGVKICVDGAIAGRTAFLSKPYCNSADKGILAMSQEELTQWVISIHRAGLRPCVHANGDAAIEMTLEAFEEALQEYPAKNPRLRIEHCTVINDRILKRLKKLGCVVTPFSTYVYYHGDKLPSYGTARVANMFAFRSFLDNDIPAAAASDYIAGPYEPLLGIQSCVTRTDIHGNIWGPEQRISIEEALRLYTQAGAYASFEENRKGTIKPGMFADFAILESNPQKVSSDTIKDIMVLETILAGKTVFSRESDHAE